jgi:cyclophilin family peptidyl-prolyl cis-trans isomerase
MFCRAAIAVLAAFLFHAPGVLAGTLVRFQGNLGTFEMELFDTNTPATVANFLTYVESGKYDRSTVHRSVSNFVIQSGGFTLATNTLLPVQTGPAVTNEPGISNLRGTVAMAKVGDDPNSATSQWFVNLVDNSANLDFQNGGFTAFGRVVGNGMNVVDAMRRVPVYDVSAALADPTFRELPLLAPRLEVQNLLLFDRVRRLPPDSVVRSFDFALGRHGFVAGFADLPANYDPGLYALTAGHVPRPVNLGGAKALFLSGANRSDDLWMFWKKKITGLIPGATYEVVIDLELASKYAVGLMGIGGPPGEGVTVKLGASTVEPKLATDGSGWLRLNLDKGNQSVGGKNVIASGHIAKPEDGNENYVPVDRNNRAAAQKVRAARDGSLWLIAGTDSGFEGTTAVYFTKLTAVFAPQRKDQTILFNAQTNHTFDPGKTFALSASNSSSLPVTFASTDTNVITVSSNVATIRGAGSAVLVATNAGNANFRPAGAARVVTVDKAAQTITFTLPRTNLFTNNGVIPLRATSSSGLQVSCGSTNTGVLVIVGTNAVMKGRGAATVAASQSGDANYLPASNVVRAIRIR